MRPAKQSPRTCDDGTLRWYCGDTFSITFVFTLKDAEGNPITPSATDKITIQFNDLHDQLIKEFSSTGSNQVVVNFTSETTQLFKEGVYNIVAKFNSDYVTTLLHNNKVIVE